MNSSIGILKQMKKRTLLRLDVSLLSCVCVCGGGGGGGSGMYVCLSLYHTHAISGCLFCYCTDPLFQNPSYPDVTFFDDPQEKVLSSSGGHVDFDNGVEITVPPCAVPLGTTVSVKVQHSFAPKDVFVMPQGIHSASPSYLITSGSKLDGDVTLTLEHHVKVSTDDDANDLLFLQADTTPQTSDSASVYEYKEVPEARTEFLPGETTGRLTTRRLSDKFVKVGRRIKEWFNSELTRQSICTYGLCESNTITCTALSTLTVVNVSRNGRGALYKPLKLLTLKTRKIHLNRPFKVIHSLHLLTDMPYVQ